MILTPARQFLWQTGRDLFSLVYPPRCEWSLEPIADGLLGSESRGRLLASAHENRCGRCGANIGPYLDAKQGSCDQCRGESFAFSGVTRLGRYDGELADAIRQIKRLQGIALAHALGDLIFRERRDELLATASTALVPVPHHRWTQWRRGYNPAQIIAESLGVRLGLPVWPNALIRVRWTPPQHYLSGTQRRQNVREAFAPKRGQRLSGARILLVDDVLTSGSTASESAKALRSGGAEQVHVVVVARGGQRRASEAIIPLQDGANPHD
jgi:ComF family protein